MDAVIKHLTRCFVAGFVALLPIGGLILTVVYAEYSISGSWLAEQFFYFPGLGLIAVVLFIYLIGLTVSNFIGKWIWGFVDSLLKKVPLLGSMYQTLKQVLGYGEDDGAVFEQAVLIPCRDLEGFEMGLVTNRVQDADGAEKVVVFVPGAPNPSAGRLVIVDKNVLKPMDMPVNGVLKALVSAGKTEIRLPK